MTRAIKDDFAEGSRQQRQPDRLNPHGDRMTGHHHLYIYVHYVVSSLHGLLDVLAREHGIAVHLESKNLQRDPFHTIELLHRGRVLAKVCLSTSDRSVRTWDSPVDAPDLTGESWPDVLVEALVRTAEAAAAAKARPVGHLTPEMVESLDRAASISRPIPLDIRGSILCGALSMCGAVLVLILIWAWLAVLS